MKILLFKPISDVYYVIQPNLGLGYLAAIMLRAGHEVHFLDSAREQLSWERFISRIRGEKYDIIGIQMYTHEVLSVKRHVELIKRHSPTTTVIVGGAHISGDPVGTMNLLREVDFGFGGEAEIGMEKFLALDKQDYADEEKLQDIGGLLWRRGDEVVVNAREVHKDLDEIARPAWQLMAPGEYPIAPHGSFSRKAPVAPMIISRGCPFECTFCAGPAVTGRILRYRSIANVLEEIKLLYHEYGAREIHIEDDNFTLKRKYVIEFCREIIKLELDLIFALPNGVRLDSLDREVLELMEQAGFYSMALGIESGSDRILKLMKKRLDTATIREKIDLIKSVTRIDLTGFFLIGYPEETEEEVRATIEFARSLPLDKASFMYVMPLPGSELQDYYIRKNRRGLDLENFFYYRLVGGLSDIPADRLKKLHRQAMWQFYRRPRIILGLLREIKTAQQVRILSKRFSNIFLERSRDN